MNPWGPVGNLLIKADGRTIYQMTSDGFISVLTAEKVAKKLKKRLDPFLVEK